MSLQETLYNWQNFYVVTGGAAAALVGLMFVAVSLGSHLVTDELMEGIRTYVTPTLFHFVAAFIIACIVLIPTHTIASLSAVVALLSLIGVRQVFSVAARMRGQIEADEDGHWLWHGFLPLIGYGLGCVVAAGLIVSQDPNWLNGLAVIVITLIVCAIRNSWLLVLWIARQH